MTGSEIVAAVASITAPGLSPKAERHAPTVMSVREASALDQYAVVVVVRTVMGEVGDGPSGEMTMLVLDALVTVPVAPSRLALTGPLDVPPLSGWA